MGLTNTIRLILALATVPLAIYAGKQDKKLKAEANPDVPESAFIVAPQYWFQPKLFTPAGNQYRVKALLTVGVMILSWVLIFVLEP